MHQHYAVILALLASYANAVPLNINLGAYSPALVVGDGEISFGGNTDVSNLMNALEGAAVAGGAANGAAGTATGTAAAAAPQAAAVTQSDASGAATIQSVPGDQSTQITALQGMGKEIAPRVIPLVHVPSEKKRDITGFNAALNYASAALKTSPEVQLGTGEGGSGVGITQKAGGVTSPAKAAAAKRQVSEEAPLKTRTVVTKMYVRGGPSLRRSQDDASAAPLEKRIASPIAEPSPGQAIDGVNLNMAEGQVAELTFIETREVADIEDDE